jgi:hypothetical protein
MIFQISDVDRRDAAIVFLQMNANPNHRREIISGDQRRTLMFVRRWLVEDLKHGSPGRYKPTRIFKKRQERQRGFQRR